MADIKWVASTRGTNPVTFMSTELQNLAVNDDALSSSQENATSLDLFMDIEFYGAMATAPTSTGGTSLEIRIVRNLSSPASSASYEDASTGGFPVLGFVGSFAVDTSTQLVRLIMPKVELPPNDFKVHLINKTTSVIQNTTGNTLRGYFFHEQAAT